ncbi:MAG: hypothetical protein AABZ39_17365 [Spirochaetota bacterium]
MKKIIFPFVLFALAVSAFAAPAKAAPKAANPLATEKDTAKLISLVIAADYKAITEDAYVAVMKNLTTVAKSIDISSADGQKNAAKVTMAIIVFRKKAKDPSSYTDGDGKSIVDNDWIERKSAGVAKDLASLSKDQFVAKIDKDYPTEEKALREEFQKAKAAK